MILSASSPHFAAEPRSYRDLPFRLCRVRHLVTATSNHGELFGLIAGAFAQYERRAYLLHHEQFADEVCNSVKQMYHKYFKIFGVEKYVMRFSTHDPSKLGQKFVNEPELWIPDGELGPRRSQQVG